MKCNDRLGRLISVKIHDPFRDRVFCNVMNSCPVFLLICTKFSIKELTKQIWGISEKVYR